MREEAGTTRLGTLYLPPSSIVLPPPTSYIPYHLPWPLRCVLCISDSRTPVPFLSYFGGRGHEGCHRSNMESLLNAGEAYVLSLPFFPGRALVGGVAFLLVLWASCVCITPCKRVRRGRRCYGPCDIALYLLTRCPCLVFLGGICAPVYIGYLGLVASNYTVVVDIDFASYLTSTSYLKSLEDAYTTLVEQQPTAQKQNARMLFEDGRERSTWSLTLLYAIRPSKNYERRGIFQKEALEEIKWVEESIRTFADYERYCY